MHARRRGIDLSGLRARCVTEEDFLRFDRIYAMDGHNLAELEQMRPQGARAKVSLLLSVVGTPRAEVPDPYSGVGADFERVLDLAEQAAQAIVVELLHASP
jgi:protein-tyrosine phosphatase